MTPYRISEKEMQDTSYFRCPIEVDLVRRRLRQVCRHPFKFSVLGKEEGPESRYILRVDFATGGDQEAFRRTLSDPWIGQSQITH